MLRDLCFSWLIAAAPCFAIDTMQTDRRAQIKWSGTEDTYATARSSFTLRRSFLVAVACTIVPAFASDVLAQSGPLVGSAAFGDWRTDKPGVSRLIRPEDLPRVGATPSSANVSRVVRRPPGLSPRVPAGF